MRIFLFFIILILASCSKRQSIGTKSHVFGKKGKHVVWIQIPGLSVEQLTLLKLTKESTNQKIALESFECLGNLWSYNLFQLRPEPFNSLMSQSLGSKNIKGECGDFDRKSNWKMYQESGYEVGFMESQTYRNPSVVDLANCKNEPNPFKNIFLWSQNTKKGTFSTFHYQEGTGLKDPGIYLDKSCQKEQCYVSFRTNVENMWEKFKDKNSRTFFVVRNWEIFSALEKNNILQLKEALQEVDKMIGFFQSKMEKESILLVVSSSASRPIILPEEGKEWAKYEKSGKNVVINKSNILGNVWAQGEGAENFCGIYDEAEVFRRFLWMPEEDILDLIF